MNFSETIHYIYSRLPVFQRVGPAAYKNSLENTLRIDDMYGNPHRQFKSIHVAGTNGKGSVSHMLAAIFQSAGYKTGLYTSPHLKDFRERIRIDGKMISKQDVTEWVENFIKNNELWKIEPSFFELTVAMAFDFFAQNCVDIAIVEVGLGGRLDSTNIITPEVSVITNIGMDHTSLLGTSIEIIANEKAGIIKTGVPVVVGERQRETTPVFLKAAARKKAPLFFSGQEFTVTYTMNDIYGNQLVAVEQEGIRKFPGLKLDLKGSYQQKNIPPVLKTVELMREKGWNIPLQAVYEGFENTTRLTGIQGRWQVLGNNPLIVCDTAHNAEGITAVVDQIRQIAFKKLHFVFGMVKDKDPEEVLRLLPANAFFYFTKADIPRALHETVLTDIARGIGLKGASYSTVQAAFQQAESNAGKDDLVFIGGSTFVVSEIL